MNEVRIRGTLALTPTMGNHLSFQSYSSLLRFDRKKFVATVFASGDIGEQLSRLHRGDEVQITGSLAMSPKGKLVIVIKALQLVQAADDHQAPRGVKELGLNRMDELNEYFMSKAD
jgi:hypothetical protein